MEGQNEDEIERSRMTLNNSIVCVVSEPPRLDEASSGTGIVVDRENGLVLTARHCIFGGSEGNYKSSELFKNILITDEDYRIRLEGYVVHISKKHDLAIIKVNHQFPSDANFTSSESLNVREIIEFQGYPGGIFKIYPGSISNIETGHFGVTIPVTEGMSGGPVIVPGEGIVGVVVLRPDVGGGGTALKADLISDYLRAALPQARRSTMKTYSLCLRRIIFNESQAAYNREEKPKLYFLLSVNDKEIIKTEPIEINGGEMQWNDCAQNEFKKTLLPGDKIEFKVLKKRFLGVIFGDKVLIKKVFEEWPQNALPDLETGVVIDGNSFIFERI